MEHCFFVGPYVEYFSPGWPACPPALAEAWDTLLNDDKQLRWNLVRGEPRVVSVGQERVVQFCGVPVARGRSAPRRMYWHVQYSWHGCYALHDLQKVDRDAEVGWFEGAYAVELEQLAGIFGAPPPVCWGLVTWMY